MRNFMLPRLLILLILSWTVTGCLPEDDRWVLPPPGELQNGRVEMGNDYDNMIFFDLSTGEQVSARSIAYDIAFTTGPEDKVVYLNSSKIMLAWNTKSTDFESINQSSIASTTLANWFPDVPSLNPDSTSIGVWYGPSGASLQEVYVLDRGEFYHTLARDRYRKLQILSVSETAYTIRVAKMDGSGEQQMVVPKDTAYTLVYVSLGNQANVVEIAPKKRDWDILFTRYTHIYYDEPLESGFRYYSVTGVIGNMPIGTGLAVQYDSLPNVKKFADFSVNDVQDITFVEKFANHIGFLWKGFNFTDGFVVLPNRYYLIRDYKGTVFKLKFFDFYDTQGRKGVPQFQYQRL